MQKLYMLTPLVWLIKRTGTGSENKNEVDISFVAT